MSITQLSTEILQKIYESASINDVINLSQTSKKNYNAYLGRQLPILRKALYNSPYSPFPELLKLVISSDPDTTRKPVGTEIRRRTAVDRVISSSSKNPHLSLNTIIKMVQHAKVAEKWTELYPQLRWRYDSLSRRILKPHEATRLRRAIYQLWTYSNLFQDRTYCTFAPEPPRAHNRDDLRFRLARTWSTIDIIRQSEFLDKIRQFIEIELYPSNTMIQFLFARAVSPKSLSKVAWGDDQEHRRLIDVLLKLNPEEILHVYQTTTTKQERLEYLLSKGKWFLTSPATWDHAVTSMVYNERSEGGREHPVLPSTGIPWKAPYIDLEDRDVEFGITEGGLGGGKHDDISEKCLWAIDACKDGEWVEEWKRVGFGRGVLLDDDSEESAASHDSEDES